jgi:hypothetical protein
MRELKLFLFTGVLGLLHFLQAQSNAQYGVLPALNFNSKIHANWRINAKIEGRQEWYLKKESVVENREARWELVDVSILINKKLGLLNAVGMGYVHRMEGAVVFHRFAQQFTRVSLLGSQRLAHRFLSDQTFSEIEPPEWRLRYRLASEIPLNGASLDRKEWYLKLGNEYVNSVQSKDYDLEIRIMPLIGFEYSEQLKLEAGLDYRIDSFVSGELATTSWWAFNIFWDL